MAVAAQIPGIWTDRPGRFVGSMRGFGAAYRITPSAPTLDDILVTCACGQMTFATHDLTAAGVRWMWC